MAEFSGRHERYLAELRSGETEAEALRMADASQDDLARWMRNRAFRESRQEAMAQRVEPGGWVAEEIPGTTMTRWRPVIEPRPKGLVRPPIPQRVRSQRPWEATSRLFSSTPNPASFPVSRS